MYSGPDGQVLSQPYSFGYNGNNQLESFTGPDNIATTYLYNGIGLRTSKTTREETRGFYYNNGSIVLETGNDGQTLATNTRGLRLISRETESDTMYYLHNTRGDVVKLTDATGNIIIDYTYDPFGNGKEVDSNKFGMNGFNPQPLAEIDNPFRYSGEYFDSETGNYYLRARYYDPAIQRFITEDSYKGQSTKPFTLNSYSYCMNDPINHVDPSGNSFNKINFQVKAMTWLTSLLSRPFIETQIDMQLLCDDVARGDKVGIATAAFGPVADGVVALKRSGPLLENLPRLTDNVFSKSVDEVAEVVTKGVVKGEVHHIASDKAIKSGFTEAYDKIFKKAGMSLQDDVNKIFLENHRGGHTKKYKQYVLDYLTEATDGLNGSQYKDALTQALDDLGKQLLENPRMPYRGGL